MAAAGSAAAGQRQLHGSSFCFSAMWGPVVPSLPAVDIGVTATSVVVVAFVGAAVPQLETV
jgi:hypothetical protein